MIGAAFGVVGGIAATRMAADTAARIIRWGGASVPAGNSGPWGVATTGGAAALGWKLLQGVNPAISTPLLLGAGVAVIEQVLATVMPLVGLGPSHTNVVAPSGSCPARPLLGVRTCAPAVFSPSTVSDPCATNFWRGRWVDCRDVGGAVSKHWCHDARFGSECCPPNTEYTKMADWPRDG